MIKYEIYKYVISLYQSLIRSNTIDNNRLQDNDECHNDGLEYHV